MSVMMRDWRGRTHTSVCLGEEVQLGIGDASRETASGTFQLPLTRRPAAFDASRGGTCG